MPKTAYPAEQQAVHACRNVRVLDRAFAALAAPPALKPSWYPWGAGTYAISLGVQDGCVVVGASGERGSGSVAARGLIATVQKDWSCRRV